MDPTNATSLPTRNVDDILAHFGVKGMHWGMRRKRTPEHPPSEDSVNAAASAQKAKRSGTKALNNKELQDLITRLNLEQQFSRIAPQTKKSKAAKTSAKFIGELMVGVGKQQATKIVSDQATKLIAQLLKK